jgi:iron complex transport system substrate-binding protein
VVESAAVALVSPRDVDSVVERILDECRAPRRPRRIVCLTEETVEILYRIGAGDLVVGVSKYVVRPPEACAKPRVSAFVKADHAAVEALAPDLVLCFSDLQADIAAECGRRGLDVVLFNQRSLAEILGVVLAVGALVGRPDEAQVLAAELRGHLERVAATTATWPRRPRVHAEEWPDPLITAIRWFAELVEVAGGRYLFPEESRASHAKDRIVDPAEVVRRDPEIVFASWCGRPVCWEALRSRPGWADMSAVRGRALHELDPACILQPGPAALTDGVDALRRGIEAWVRG